MARRGTERGVSPNPHAVLQRNRWGWDPIETASLLGVTHRFAHYTSRESQRISRESFTCRVTGANASVLRRFSGPNLYL